jgi:signal recognition particle GTPase
VLIGLIVTYKDTLYGKLYNSLNRFGDKAGLMSQNMIASKCEILLFSKEKYQERVVLEKKIKAAMDKNASDNGFYTIIAGVKGAGKTTLVEKICQNRTGVIRIAVNNEDTIKIQYHYKEIVGCMFTFICY